MEANNNLPIKVAAVLPNAIDAGEIVFYQPDNSINLEVRIAQETVWLSQSQMAELFGTQRQAITKHLKNIFDTGELVRESTSSILELLRKEGSRIVKRQVELFNLDVIIYFGGLSRSNCSWTSTNITASIRLLRLINSTRRTTVSFSSTMKYTTSVLPSKI